jgi:hypothetical protein
VNVGVFRTKIGLHLGGHIPDEDTKQDGQAVDISQKLRLSIPPRCRHPRAPNKVPMLARPGW